jgi:Ca2+-binding RTX toxin-like protein
MFGGAQNDFMRGGIGDDSMEGNADTDTMRGDAGQDDMIGGSSVAGQPDSRDLIYGDTNHDVIAGDNAAIVRPTNSVGQWVTDTFSIEIVGVVRRVVTLHDVPTTAGVPPIETSGNDELFGDDGYDILYGQGSDDSMRGGNLTDVLYGNAGADQLYGDAGQDDLIGGTGRIVSSDPATAVDGRLDGADIIYGGNGLMGVREGDDDVIAGDNATIDRPVDNMGQWQMNTFNAAVQRSIVLYDADSVNRPAGAGASGSDTLYAEFGDDLLFGQGADDVMVGGEGFNYMEGNAGHDQMNGDDGRDDMIGGGSANDGVIDPDRIGDGLIDGMDMMNGHDDGDVMAGDNARITRPTDKHGQWLKDVNTNAVLRDVVLFDVQRANTPLDPRVSGNDNMVSEDGYDILFGQGGDDTMSGGTIR